MMNDDRPTSLDGLDLGERGTIIRIGCPGPLRHRLMDMGLTPGTEVRLEGVAPLGDPIIVSARGCRLRPRRHHRQPVAGFSTHRSLPGPAQAWPAKRRVTQNACFSRRS